MFFLLLTHILEKQQHFESQESLCLKKVLRRIVTALTHLINETKVETLVILGDFFHARLGKTDEVHQILFEWREIFKELKILLIRGNHDIKSGDPWTDLNIQCHPDPFDLYDFECRHIPITNSNKPFLAGHIHPRLHP